MTQIKRTVMAFAAAAAGLALAVSCVQEQNIDRPEESGFITGIMVSGEDPDLSDLPETKVSYTSNLSFSWTADDVLGIFPVGGYQQAFPLSDFAGGKTAKFDGGAWALRSSYEYACYYPFDPDKHDTNDMKISVDYRGQKQVGNGSVSKLGEYSFFFADATRPSADGSVNLQMKQAGGLMRIRAVLPEGGISLTKATVSVVGAKLKVAGKVDLSRKFTSYSDKVDAPHIVSAISRDELSIDLSSITTTSSKREVVVWLWMPPQTLKGKEVELTLTGSNGATYSSRITSTKDITANSASGFDFGEVSAALRPQLKSMIDMVDNAAALGDVNAARDYFVNEEGYSKPVEWTLDYYHYYQFESSESVALYMDYEFDVRDEEENILGTIVCAMCDDSPFELMFTAARMLPSSSYFDDMVSMADMLSRKYATGSAVEAYWFINADGECTREDWEYALVNGKRDVSYSIQDGNITRSLEFYSYGGNHVEYTVYLSLPKPSFTLSSGKKVEYDSSSPGYQWGEMIPIDGDLHLRSLTKEEWEYILTGRPNADNLWARGTRDGENCIYILPDGLNPDYFFNTKGAGSKWTDNSILGSDIYSNRIICLPCRGYTKDGTSYGDYGGFYWTASENEWGSPYYLTFDKDLGPRVNSNGITFPKETMMGLALFKEQNN